MKANSILVVRWIPQMLLMASVTCNLDRGLDTLEMNNPWKKLLETLECTENDNCNLAGFEVCDKILNQCVCAPFYESNYEMRRSCSPCPDEGLSCSGCCASNKLRCISGVCQRCRRADENDECITNEALFFMTAAQVALATVMVMGISALITLLYKICTKSTFTHSRTIASDMGPDTDRPAMRVSVTSMQQRIINQMHDRPPCYESRHNYNFNNGSRVNNSSQVQANPTDPITSYVGPPPFYDGDGSVLTGELPPPYTEGVTPATSSLSTNNQTIDQTNIGEGNVNNAFVSDNSASLVKNNSDNVEILNSRNLNVNATDKVLHI